MVVGGLAVPRLTCRDRVSRGRYFPHKPLSHLARDRGDGSLQSAYIVREWKTAGQRANAARPKKTKALAPTGTRAVQPYETGCWSSSVFPRKTRLSPSFG